MFPCFFQELLSYKDGVNCVILLLESCLQFREDSVSEMMEQVMEHDTSKDSACNIKKGDAAAVFTVLSVAFPLVDSNDGGILPGVRDLALFLT